MPTKKTRKSIKSGGLQAKDDNADLKCCDSHNGRCLNAAKKIIKSRLFNIYNDFYFPDFLVEQHKQLKTVVDQCILYGESNSVLIIGPRGTGKTKLVHKVLLEAAEKKDENYFCVQLNGFIHTDDRVALQDMARQLELDNVVGEKVFGSFADNLAFILDALKQDKGKSKSIIIVLEEFDLFTSHKNQSLIYNLFDVSQSRQNPLCVVGVTCRLDVVELLEKRVRSRYSHRSILTFPDYPFSKYLSMCRDLLTLPSKFECGTYKQRWNKQVDGLIDEKSFTDILERHFNVKKDVFGLLQLMILPVSNLCESHPFITSSDISDCFSHIHMDAKAALLAGLSVLELCLIVAAKHVLERREGQPFNFEMVYNEYQNFLKRRSTGIQSFTKPVTFKAYEHLIGLELIKCTEHFQNNLAKEFKPTFMLIENTQIMETLRMSADCPTELKNWAEYMFT